MVVHDAGQKWFLAQLKPNSVKRAKTNLERQGFKVFLPLEDRTLRRGSRFVNVEQPLFPGYIFVGFDATEGLWRAVNSTSGITRLVSFGNEPAPVPLDLVSKLMLRCGKSGKVLPPKLLKPGDLAQLTSGPFADFVAEIESIAPDRRIWVLIEIMGAQTRVEVSLNQLKKV